MAATQSIEQLIEIASFIKKTIEAIRAGYYRLGVVIEKEHRGVGLSDYTIVQEACVEKAQVADEIELEFSTLAKVSEDVAALKAQILNCEYEKLANLTAVKNALTDIASSFPITNFAAQVLKHQATGVAQEADGLLSDLAVLKPKIEANRYLVTSILSNMQESYRFWQEVSEQIAISYDKMGQQKAAGRNSGFKIRA